MFGNERSQTASRSSTKAGISRGRSFRPPTRLTIDLLERAPGSSSSLRAAGERRRPWFSLAEMRLRGHPPPMTSQSTMPTSSIARRSGRSRGSTRPDLALSTVLRAGRLPLIPTMAHWPRGRHADQSARQRRFYTDLPGSAGVRRKNFSKLAVCLQDVRPTRRATHPAKLSDLRRQGTASRPLEVSSRPPSSKSGASSRTAAMTSLLAMHTPDVTTESAADCVMGGRNGASQSGRIIKAKKLFRFDRRLRQEPARVGRGSRSGRAASAYKAAFLNETGLNLRNAPRHRVGLSRPADGSVSPRQGSPVVVLRQGALWKRGPICATLRWCISPHQRDRLRPISAPLAPFESEPQSPGPKHRD
jgi:hypothetical protein